MKSLAAILTILFAISFSNRSIGQERYKDEISDSARVETYTYAYKDGKSLDLDVYFPMYDNQTNRPLILFVHGGGFAGGKRNDLWIQQFCKKTGTARICCFFDKLSVNQRRNNY